MAARRHPTAGFALRRVAAGLEDAYFRTLFAGWPQPPSAAAQLARLHPTAAMVCPPPPEPHPDPEPNAEPNPEP